MGVFPNLGHAIQEEVRTTGVNELPINGSITIWVDGDRTDTYTATGSVLSPYTTIAAALAAVTATRNSILILPGEYTITASLVMPSFAFSMTGLGGTNSVEINAAQSVSPLIDCSPTLTASAILEIRNIYINNSESSQIGIQVDNDNCTMGSSSKLYLKLEEVEIGDGGAAIDSDHDYATAAIRLTIKNCYIEGAINFDVGHSGDRIKAYNCTLEGLITLQGDNVASEWRFWNCWGMPNGAAFAGGSGSNTIICLGCYVSNNTALETGDIGGSFSETIIA